MWWWCGSAVIAILVFLPVLPRVLFWLLGMPDGLDSSDFSVAVMPWLLLLTVPAGLVAWLGMWLFSLGKLINRELRKWEEWDYEDNHGDVFHDVANTDRDWYLP